MFVQKFHSAYENLSRRNEKWSPEPGKSTRGYTNEFLNLAEAYRGPLTPFSFRNSTFCSVFEISTYLNCAQLRLHFFRTEFILYVSLTFIPDFKMLDLGDHSTVSGEPQHVSQ